MIMKMGRISTGIYGLDDLMGGGFRENTINAIRGGTGVGKTTFALQYTLYSLNRGEKVLFISFEMSEKQILRDCMDIGWHEIKDHIEKENLKIIHIFGEDLTFPSLDLAEMIRTSIPYNCQKIVIDPLTHPTFYTEKEIRKSLSTIFQELRRIGTTLIVLEEPANGHQIYEPSAMPLYLADTVIHLQNLGFGELYDRTLRIMKHRGSKHGDSIYPYTIEMGMGIVLRASDKQIERVKSKNKFDAVFDDAIAKARSMGVIGEGLSARIGTLQKNWTRDEDPTDVLNLVLREERKGYEKRA
jgi:circadian clock protein KaiC